MVALGRVVARQLQRLRAVADGLVVEQQRVVGDAAVRVRERQVLALGDRLVERIGVLSVGQYISNWRIAVISIVILSAVLTPADPWSMFFMAVPLVFLYGLGLLMCKYLPRGGEE